MIDNLGSRLTATPADCSRPTGGFHQYLQDSDLQTASVLLTELTPLVRRHRRSYQVEAGESPFLTLLSAFADDGAPVICRA